MAWTDVRVKLAGLEQFQASLPFCPKPNRPLKVLLLATSAEKILQDSRAFILQEAGRDMARMIESGHL